MTELFLNPRPVHDGRGSGSSNEGQMSLITRCSVFKDHSAGSTGLVASLLRPRSRKKTPRRGARYRPAGYRPIWAPLTRRLFSRSKARATGEYRPLALTCSSNHEALELALPDLDDSPLQLGGIHVELTRREHL